MSTLDLLPILGLAVVFSAIILAAHILSSNVWHLCPRCRRWHSELGILRQGQKPPASAKIDYLAHEKCDVCK